jgi:hypothetical protein
MAAVSLSFARGHRKQIDTANRTNAEQSHREIAAAKQA